MAAVQRVECDLKYAQEGDEREVVKLDGYYLDLA
jgi:hypothetical protein